MELVDALDRLLEAVAPLPVEEVSAQDACGRVAAEDVAAPAPVPQFRRAAMDGYVCHGADVKDIASGRPVLLRVTGTVRMGAPPGPGPERGEAWAITTGGPMPERGDRVVPSEEARPSGDLIRLDRPPAGRRNVAEIGEDIRAGDPLLTAGDEIGPAQAAALAACGVRLLRVRRRPRVALAATGSELSEAGADAPPLPPGRVFNSNSVVLWGALASLGCAVEYRGIVPDDRETLRETLAALRDAPYDAVVTTGGVSVGRFDAVHRTWLDLGARRVVGRVDLKPGGPFFAGLSGGTWGIGLSGTPVACLAAFHLLVQPFFRTLAGRRRAVRPLRTARLAAPLGRRTDRMRALWVRIGEGARGIPEINLLTGTPAGNYSSLLRANGLALIPPGTPALPAGSRVTVLQLDAEEDRDRLAVERPVPGPVTVGIIGAAGEGKTTILAGVVKRLAAAGVRAAAVKHAAHGFAVDRAGSDSQRAFESGAAVVVLAGPEETAVRIAAPGADPDRLVRLCEDAAVEAWGAPPDVVFLEGFAHPARPVITVGEPKRGTTAAEVWAAVPAVRDLTAEQIALEVERVEQAVRSRLVGGAERPRR